MIKIWCERCEGSGGLDRQSITGLPYKQRCPRCAGLGYIKNAELEHKAKIGEATEKVFEQCDPKIDFLTSKKDGTAYLKIIRNKKDLLDWAESEGE